ncbi:unnamed protein product [Nezara viridula]|uniref:Glucose-methanol-choline oxidoreductase N-terminal domain-containing protein n=1 Tax=Nezara viridula TaxID=85310 RepID=A0A9P0MNF4_NEZVI|nr:unnamed protein product [Nezara viridula]
MYVRGNRRDYDMWAARGNPGWSYNEILPYFRLSEDNETPKYRADRMYHGVGGYLTVGISPYLTPLANAFVTAGEQMGYRNIDFNAANQTGFMIPEATIRNGTRCSTAKAFLRPARNRPNLIVSYYSTVTRILIGEVNKTAYGVQFLRNGTYYTVYASKEVIVCAGSTNSPQLLLLSGVGPEQQLKSMNIPVYANLPVGQNLQDHAGVPLFFLVNQSVTITRRVYESGMAIFDYAMEVSSPLSDPLATETIGFVNSPYANPNIDYPDVEMLMCTSLPNHFNELQLFYIVVLTLHPKSVGNITLASSNPFQAPLINPGYFSVASDYPMLVTATKMAYNISLTPALQAYNSTLFLPLYPQCNSLPFLSEAFWTCLVSNYSTTVFHAGGTCRMGPSSDPTAVVDPHLRVHNITGLRVIDASIMPIVVSGNTNAAIIMIGERGSAFIYQDYNVRNPTPAT